MCRHCCARRAELGINRRVAREGVGVGAVGEGVEVFCADPMHKFVALAIWCGSRLRRDLHLRCRCRRCVRGG